jgi:uncharacterized protein (TIGR02996 family)
VSLSTLQDGIAALLECPLEQTLHRQLVDRICEDSGDPRRALLDVVLRHRASDGPRLAYATFCEMNGEAERGEFIRVQCELAPLEKSGSAADPRQGLDIRMRYTTPPAFERMKELRARERVLFRGKWDAELGDFANATHIAPSWRRGFVWAIQSAAEVFIAHSDALRAHPVEKVVLTTAPDIRYKRDAYTDPHAPGTILRVKARWGKYHAQEEAFLSEEELKRSALAPAVAAERWSAQLEARVRPEELLRSWFPGIEFQLPHAITGNTSWATGTSTDVNVELDYVDEQVPVTNEFANYSQQLHDDIIRGSGIPAHIAKPE